MDGTHKIWFYLKMDTLVLLAMELNYADVIKFCPTFKKNNKYICQNNNFWRNKLDKDYPYTKNFDKNNKKLYNFLYLDK